MRYPDYIKSCIDALQNAGFSAYAVGGAVRDSLLGRQASDFDVTTNATPEESAKVFEGYRTIPTGIRHGTLTVLFEGIPVEITTFRIDGEYEDCRHPSSVSFTRNLADDLSRRDFTVNAMAYNEKEGVIDLFGGKDDLERKLIRCVGEPEKRFSEDALRILRAFRFSAQLGFEIEKNTLEGAQGCAHLLPKIARERVRVEFLKLLGSENPTYSLNLMIEKGVFAHTFEGLPIPCKRAISTLEKLGSALPRLSALIFDCTEEEKHEFLNSLRLSNEEKKITLRLCRAARFKFEENERSARIFLSYFNDILSDAVNCLEAFSESTEKFIELVKKEAEKKPPLKISDLAVSGNDLVPIFANDRARIGKALNHLLEFVIENPKKNTKEYLIEEAKKGDF